MVLGIPGLDPNARQSRELKAYIDNANPWEALKFDAKHGTYVQDGTETNPGTQDIEFFSLPPYSIVVAGVVECDQLVASGVAQVTVGTASDDANLIAGPLDASSPVVGYLGAGGAVGLPLLIQPTFIRVSVDFGAVPLVGAKIRLHLLYTRLGSSD